MKGAMMELQRILKSRGTILTALISGLFVLFFYVMMVSPTANKERRIEIVSLLK